ncbi:tocopherol cyclase family protein [Austwickia chelonae]|uniref:tocopherol cyclase family protein n=1 Tax=Austwickia chelonae TaxID=100225 RepID=UPI000E26E1C5|nr:tocopherol cyclase family protein [Austwickia chelonae]
MARPWHGLRGCYRSTGADGPYGDPTGSHDVAMEGYFWRFTTPAGATAIVLAGINRDTTGRHWTTLGVADHPAGRLVVTAVDDGRAGRHGIDARACGPLLTAPDRNARFTGTADQVHLDMPGAHVDVRVRALRPYPSGPRHPFGGSSLFQMVPGLNQYWHPWALGGRATGAVVVDGSEMLLEDAEVYAEKNWGREGFPDSWWWGQSQGFGDGACVAFAGGQVTAGPLCTEVTALVVALPDGQVLRLGNPVVSPVRAQITDERWRLLGRNRTWTVLVHGEGSLDDAHVLPVPLPSTRRNTPGAVEHLGAQMSVSVWRRGCRVWSGTSTAAGLEHGGRHRTESELRRRGAPAGVIAAAPAHRSAATV